MARVQKTKPNIPLILVNDLRDVEFSAGATPT